MQPGQFNPKGEDWIGRELAELRRELRELKAANIFGLTKITPKDGGTDFDGFVNVNGSMSINGPLILQPGSIENDSLASPLRSDAGKSYIVGAGVTTTSTVVSTITFTVPEGFTQASVAASALAMAVNSTASLDYLYAESVINGVGGGEVYTYVPAGNGNSVSIPYNADLTGLSGGDTFDVSVAVRTSNGAWAPDASNLFKVYAQVLYLR